MSPTKKPEQLSTPTTSTFRERVASGELHFLANLDQEMLSYSTRLSYSDLMEQNKSLENLRSKFGKDGVVVSNAMRDGQPDGIPGMVGVYVDTQKWAKLHPEQ